MYLFYITLLIFLLIILVLLRNEERRLKYSATHGLASKFWVLRERRRYLRFDENLKIRYNVLSKTPRFKESKTTNLSRKGVCLVTYEKLKQKKLLDLEIDIPGFSKPVKFIGQLMWIKDLQSHDDRGRRLFYVGVRFMKIAPEAEAILLTHLNNLKAVKE